MKIGITTGDLNGIGPEVILKAISQNYHLDNHTVIIYGSGKVMAYHKNIVDNIDVNFSNISTAENPPQGKISVVNCWNEDINIILGKATPEAGQFAHVALDRAVNDLKAGYIDVLVTAPINKHTMDEHSFPFGGHTEYLTDAFGANESLMMMVSGDLKIAVATNHIPVSQINEKFTKELLLRKINLFYHSLKKDFGKEKPMIAILGMNPHAGDNGRIGTEDEEIIKPTILELKKKGVMVFGPYAADGFFGSSQHQKFDGILAMYHDQGLIPFKTLSFGKGINFTAGLSIVRTSPDHGTGYDIAGDNKADASSMREAIFLAMDVYENRRNLKEILDQKAAEMAKPVVADE